MELQTFLLKFQDIKRIVYLPGKGDISENDVEHSYHLALAAWFLAQHFAHLDTDKVIRYALVHDLVEIHAGDTYIFATDGSKDTKQQREAEALERIKKDWADFPEMIESMTAYETKSDEESKFVYALDKIMPVMLNFLGEGYGWHKHNVSIELLHEHKKDKASLSPEIDEYYQQLYKLLQKHPHYFPAKD